MLSTNTPKSGKRVWLELTSPIKLTNFDTRSLDMFLTGSYAATWIEKRIGEGKSLVLFIDNTNAGVEKSSLDELVAKGLASIA